MTIKQILSPTDDGGLMFECPGCGIPHVVKTGDGNGPRWGWNGNMERPTFTPSLLVHYDHWVPAATDDNLAQIKSGEIVQTKVNSVCHSFITDGRIQFLGDCTHSLAGQTIDIPAWED